MCLSNVQANNTQYKSKSYPVTQPRVGGIGPALNPSWGRKTAPRWGRKTPLPGKKNTSPGKRKSPILGTESGPDFGTDSHLDFWDGFRPHCIVGNSGVEIRPQNRGRIPSQNLGRKLINNGSVSWPAEAGGRGPQGGAEGDAGKAMDGGALGTRNTQEN